jgi:4-amino-4-deoxy-L-arabinose transferase-like glycosyltransferase
MSGMEDRVESEASPPPRSANGGAPSARPPASEDTRWIAASRFISLLLVVFVAKQVFLTAATYPFSGHDELAHYSYVRTLVTEWRIPVLPDLITWREGLQGREPPPTDEIPAELYQYCRFTLDWFCQPDNVSWRNNPPRNVFVPGMGNYPSGYQYVANHPPLYYAAVAPVYVASSSLTPLQQHYLLRLAAIPLGLVTVYAAYRTARVLFPGDAFMTVTVPAFVAFQPQISYEAAMVNNDIAAIAITSLLIWAIVVGMRNQFPVKLCLVIGLLLGAGLLAKGTTMAIVPVVGLAVLLAVGWRDWRGLVVRGAAIGIPAALLAAPWYLFLQRTYGDFSGLARVEELQYWNGPMGSFFSLLTNPNFVLGRFRETWGEFGWRLIHLSVPLLWAIAIPTIAALVGVLIYSYTTWRGRSILWADGDSALGSWQVKALIVLAIACVVAYLAVVQFGTSFALAQARYFFPVVNAAAILLMLGLRTLVPLRFRPAGQGIVVAALIALNVVIMTAYVVPFTATFDEPVMPWSWGG